MRAQGLLAGEGKQLPHEPRGAVRILLDVHDVLEGRIGRAVVHQEEVGEADDRRQHVVEVVGDAAGELAHRLHLLALGDLHFEHALLGGLDGVDDRRLVLAFRLLDGAQIEAGAARLVALEGDVHGHDLALPRDRGVEGFAQGLLALAPDQGFERQLLQWRLVERAIEETQEGGIGGTDGARPVHGGDGDGGGMEQAREIEVPPRPPPRLLPASG